MEPAVSVRDLTYRYRGQDKAALDGVSLVAAFGPENFQVDRWELAPRWVSVPPNVR